MNFHPLANIFPLIEGQAFDDLCADIRAHGVREPVWLYEGQILDGRNRWRAAAASGITCPIRDYTGSNPLEFVLSLNLHRRQLSASDLGFVAIKLEEAAAVLAKARMLSGKAPDPMEIIPQGYGKSRDWAAAAVGVNPRYVQDAKKIQAVAPELAIEIKSGKKNIPQAMRELKEAAREQRRDENRELIEQAPSVALTTAKFATILIDPPWDWGDEGDADQLGRARPTYGTMSLEQLMELPVGDMSDIDCHLYLWITNRSLPKGFALMEQWGFRYITALTWCKPSIGMGNYFRGSTEQVLFGVKGSQMLKRKDVGTWFAAPRGPNGHSSKPVEFYSLVESCSPGPYLEMFARSSRTGWSAWGAEANAA
jgi:N6-adenosine-specific RNA methylase IME4